VLDTDGDGRLDVVAVSRGKDRLFVNDGTGHFFDDTASAVPVDRSDGRSAAAAHMTLDGKLDLAIANRGSVNGFYLRRGKHGFEDVTPSMSLVAAGTLAIVPLDLERDGNLDLFVLVAKGEASMQYVSTDRSEKR
jgi:ABC-type sulfate transport system substrate-binding protein